SRELSQLLFLSIAVAAVAVLYLAKEVVLPFAFALLFAFLLSPLVNLLERIHLPRILAIALVILASIAVVGGIGYSVFTQLVEVADRLPAYTANIDKKIDAFHSAKPTDFSRALKEVERLSTKVGALHLGAAAPARPTTRTALGASPKRPVSVQEVGQNSGGALSTLHGVVGALVGFLLVVVFTFFMLLQREDLRNRFIRLTGRGHLNMMTQAMDEASHRVSRYFALLVLVNCCYGAVIFVILHFMGLPHALLWGGLTTVLRFIPYIGAPISALLPTAFALAVFPGWTQALLVLGTYIVIELVTANFLEPKLYGKHTGLSPLAILVIAIFWALLWGPIGLFLSVPLTVCLVVVGSHVPSLKFLTVLLGDQPVMRPEAHYYQRLLASDEQEASQVLDNALKDKSVAQVYDDVLIPALALFEQDRHRNALDQETVNFITETTEEQVEDLAQRSEEDQALDLEMETSSNANPATPPKKAPPSSPAVRKRIVCVPVRDESDRVIAVMLSHLLRRAGHFAKIIHVASAERMLAATFKLRPDAVCLSALPPYAMSHARTLYEALRSRHPEMEVVIGLWDYSGDLEKAAKVTTGEQEIRICTTLAQAVERIGVPETAPPSQPSLEPNVAEIPG
ncbi:MAG: AI-2E family transporter, partial [Acidobacteriaceae bacterium]